ncbi:MAG: glycosyltransferase family 4 protein [Aquabacterium sp.]|nr:glycosyltransferase family 4 protein [Aquabacterium sp.]
MQRIALIVQRYGSEINGGAELHARQWAGALRAHYEVDVLTSCALDYQTWDRHFEPGESWLDGCRVLRFEHPPHRRVHMPLRHKLRYLLRRALVAAGMAPVARPNGRSGHDGIDYLRGKGPTMDGLMDYLQTQGPAYSALIFFSAFFHPAALGVLIHPGRSLLVPTLHDEKGMYLPQYHRVFRAPRAILYNTAAEQAVAQALYGHDLAPARLCGVGMAARPPADPGDAVAAARFAALAARLGLPPEAPYLLYVGRVDRSKGCAELFDHFAALRRQHPAPLTLVVCGQWFMPVPAHPDIVRTGFVSDADRDDLLAHAAALVVPSRYESLSMVLLEGLAAGCPVLVNRDAAVLRDHVQASGAGQTYAGPDEFVQAALRLLAMDPAARADEADRGRDYVASQYSWERIVARIREAIDTCDPPRPTAAAPATES